MTAPGTGKAAATNGKAAPAKAAAKAVPKAGAQDASRATAPRRRLLRRVLTGARVAAVLLALTLVAGTIGYREVAGLSWLIAFHQASLLLAGMGPVITDLPDRGRMFESIYALFCGVVLLGATGILFTPFIHHMLHAFHVEDSGGDGK